MPLLPLLRCHFGLLSFGRRGAPVPGVGGMPHCFVSEDRDGECLMICTDRIDAKDGLWAGADNPIFPRQAFTWRSRIHIPMHIPYSMSQQPTTRTTTGRYSGTTSFYFGFIVPHRTRTATARTPRTLMHKVNPGTLAERVMNCLLYTSPSPRDRQKSRMPSSA